MRVIEYHSGQPFVAENRTGAGGMVAAEITKKSAPDGRTLLPAGARAISPATRKKLFY